MELPDIYNVPIFKAIGLSIVHSFWQAFIILSVMKLALILISKKYAVLRYKICATLMVVLVACLAVTFFSVYSPASINDSDGLVTKTQLSPNSGDQTRQSDPVITGFEISFAVSKVLNKLSPYLAIVWIVGFVFVIVKLALSAIYLNRLRQLPGEPHEISHLIFQGLVKKMAIARPVQLIVTKKIMEPLTFGFLKPVILLPLGYVMGVPGEEAQMIIAHELSHIKRNDYLFNITQSIFDAIYFFNPFYKEISNAIRNEREYCCDDLASRTCGDEETMAIALTNLRYLATHSKLALSASPVRSSFHERIYRLVLPVPDPKSSNGIGWIISIVLIITCLMLFIHCGKSANNSSVPDTRVALNQVYTDNQANHKIEVFSYHKGGRLNQLFLVSTEDGQPLYAYLNGSKLSATNFLLMVEAVKKSKNINPQQLAALHSVQGESRSARASLLNKELDSLHSLISKLNGGSTVRNDLLAESKLRTDEIIALAMKDYNEDTKNIAVDIKLSSLLQDIVVKQQFTLLQQEELNTLLLSR